MSFENLRFSTDHEWVRQEGNNAFIGISDYAQHELGDIVYVEFPGVGTVLTAGKAFGSVESVKAVSDMISPLSGKVLKLNGDIENGPELLNEAPYDNWIIELELANPAELEGLMKSDDYEKFCKRES